MNFNTLIDRNKINLYFDKQLDVGYFSSIASKFVSIKWDMEITSDKSGVSFIKARVLDQDITIMLEFEDPSSGEVHESDRTFNLSEVEVQYTRAGSDDSTPMGLFPTALEYSNGKWIVTFATHWA